MNIQLITCFHHGAFHFSRCPYSRSPLLSCDLKTKRHGVKFWGGHVVTLTTSPFGLEHPKSSLKGDIPVAIVKGIKLHMMFYVHSYLRNKALIVLRRSYWSSFQRRQPIEKHWRSLYEENVWDNIIWERLLWLSHWKFWIPALITKALLLNHYNDNVPHYEWASAMNTLCRKATIYKTIYDALNMDKELLKWLQAEGFCLCCKNEAIKNWFF